LKLTRIVDFVYRDTKYVPLSFLVALSFQLRDELGNGDRTN
jgi:hypothetical protein